MKRLTLIRHALAEDKLPGQRDWDRPLSKSGEMDAATMAMRLKIKNHKPDLILMSSALRTQQTAERFHHCFPSAEIEPYDELYLATSSQLLRLIHTQPDNANHLMIIGHNPGLTEFADMISNEYRIQGMPTASLVTMKLDITSWQALKPAMGSSVELDHPHN